MISPNFIKGKIFAQNFQSSNKNHLLPACRDFKIDCSRPLVTIIFRPKIIILHTNSILTRSTMVEFLMYCVIITI